MSLPVMWINAILRGDWPGSCLEILTCILETKNEDGQLAEVYFSGCWLFHSILLNIKDQPILLSRFGRDDIVLKCYV